MCAREFACEGVCAAKFAYVCVCVCAHALFSLLLLLHYSDSHCALSAYAQSFVRDGVQNRAKLAQMVPNGKENGKNKQ